ncbi:hypothetical protein C2U31_13955 [Achromobacter sp. AONIH1]|nr:hypothetical protein C2U31_13955 [Achromobacter sp. AONIH1]
MEVILRDDQGNDIWSRWSRDGQSGGLACRSYISDGTQARIIDALANALQQARLESSCLQNLDAMSDIRASATKIQCDIPVSR